MRWVAMVVVLAHACSLAHLAAAHHEATASAIVHATAPERHQGDHLCATHAEDEGVCAAWEAASQPRVTSSGPLFASALYRADSRYLELPRAGAIVVSPLELAPKASPPLQG